MSHYFQEPKFSDHFSPSPSLLFAAVQTAIPLLPISPHPWLCNISKTTAANAYTAEVLWEKYSQLPLIQLSKWKPVREPTPPDQPALPAPQASVLGTTSRPQTTSLGITVLNNIQSSYYSTPCSLSCSGYYFIFFLTSTVFPMTVAIYGSYLVIMPTLRSVLWWTTIQQPTR